VHRHDHRDQFRFRTILRFLDASDELMFKRAIVFEHGRTRERKPFAVPVLPQGNCVWLVGFCLPGGT